MEKHFVVFYSPGTVVAETSSREIDSWDTDVAVKMSAEITERYGARPYGFRFETHARAPEDLDSHIEKTSAMYYLGGVVKTLADVKAENDPTNAILISNMEGNGYARVIVNSNSWRTTRPLNDGDVVLDV